MVKQKSWTLFLIIAGISFLTGCGGAPSEEAPLPKVERAETGVDGVKTVPGSAAIGAGTIAGKISFSGTAPTPSSLDMAADPVCASKANADSVTEDVVVGSGNGLKNVFLYIKEGLPSGNFATSKKPVTLDQQGCRYQPHVLGIQVGQELTILNSDGTLHNVHGMPKASKEFNLGMPIKGMKLKRKFSAPEVMVKFKCDVHPWMSAYVGVLNHPFFAVSAADGTFKIENVPAGSYTLEAWHEKMGTQTVQVTVAPGGTGAADFTFSL